MNWLAVTLLLPLLGFFVVLFTPRDVQLGLGDRARGSMVVVSAASPLSESWFRFDDDVDFTTSMPPEQRPKMRNEG